MKEGTGQSAPRLPVARTESRLSARAPDPSPLARATPHRSGRAPARSPTTPPKSSTPTAPTTGAIKTNTANGANNTDPKTGLKPDAEGATTSPNGPSGYVRTTTDNSNPVKSGEVTETRQTSKRGHRNYHPRQSRQAQTQTTTGDPPHCLPVRVCPRLLGLITSGACERPRQ
jgi:hypothetical protein